MSGADGINRVLPNGTGSDTQQPASAAASFVLASPPTWTFTSLEEADESQLPVKKRRTYLNPMFQAPTQVTPPSFNFANIGSNFPSPTTTPVSAGNTLWLGADSPLPPPFPQPVLFNANPYTSYGEVFNAQTPFLPGSEVPTAGWQQLGGFPPPPPAYTLPLYLPATATETPPTNSAEYPGGTLNLTPDAPIPGPPHANPQTPQEFYENSLYAIKPKRNSSVIKGRTIANLDDPNSVYAYLMANPNVYRSAGEIAKNMGMEPGSRYNLSQTMNSTINATLLPLGFDAVRLPGNLNRWEYAFLLDPNMKAKGQRGKVYKPPEGHQRNCARPPTK
jgi:hypothetical protein